MGANNFNEIFPTILWTCTEHSMLKCIYNGLALLVFRECLLWGVPSLRAGLVEELWCCGKDFHEEWVYVVLQVALLTGLVLYRLLEAHDHLDQILPRLAVKLVPNILRENGKCFDSHSRLDGIFLAMFFESKCKFAEPSETVCSKLERSPANT